MERFGIYWVNSRADLALLTWQGNQSTKRSLNSKTSFNRNWLSCPRHTHFCYNCSTHGTLVTLMGYKTSDFNWWFYNKDTDNICADNDFHNGDNVYNVNY